MNRRTSLLVGIVAIGVAALAVAGVAPVTAVADSVTTTADHDESDRAIVSDVDEDPEESENESTSIRPGEQFAGAVGVQAAEIDGEVASRAFGLRLAAAETDAERAAVIADRIERNERQLDRIGDQQAELRDRRDAGELSDGAYAARTARTVAEVRAVNWTTDGSADAAVGLSEELLAEQGVDADRIRALQGQADELSGPEVAEWAREIGGNRTGAPFGPDRGNGPGAGVGAPGPGDGQSENGTESSERGNEAADGDGESERDDGNESEGGGDGESERGNESGERDDEAGSERDGGGPPTVGTVAIGSSSVLVHPDS